MKPLLIFKNGNLLRKCYKIWMSLKRLKFKTAEDYNPTHKSPISTLAGFKLASWWTWNYLYKIWFTSIGSDSCFPIPSYHLLESHTAWDVMRVRICSGKWKESHISGWWANKIVYQCILVWNGVKWRKSHLCGWLANSGVPSHAGWSYRPKHTVFRFMNIWQKIVETFLSKKYYA